MPGEKFTDFIAFVPNLEHSKSPWMRKNRYSNSYVRNEDRYNHASIWHVTEIESIVLHTLHSRQLQEEEEIRFAVTF